MGLVMPHRRLLLAAAALVLASAPTTARAEEALPPDAALRLCDWAGPGFAPIAGTDSCVRLGGQVTVTTGFVAAPRGAGGSVSTARGRARLETKTPTALGTVRIILDLDKELAGEPR